MGGQKRVKAVGKGGVDKMKLENQVVSLELAKEMKEAGFPQDTQWYWHEHFWRKKQKKTYFITDKRLHLAKICSAPTVAEMGEALSWGIVSGKAKDVNTEKHLGYWCDWIHSDDDSKSEQKADTEADARAKMWLYLKKEGLLKEGDE